MRAKRKALHNKGADKSGLVKLAPLPATPEELNDGVKHEDLARLENEGGASDKAQGVVAMVEKGD